MGQLVKLILILVMIAFTAAILAVVVHWLVVAVVTSAPAWLAGCTAGCLTGWLHFRRRWQACQGMQFAARSHGDLTDVERALEPATAALLSSTAGAVVTAVVVACGQHESAPVMLALYLISVGLTVVVSLRAVALIKGLYLWRAERRLSKLRAREPFGGFDVSR